MQIVTLRRVLSWAECEGKIDVAQRVRSCASQLRLSKAGVWQLHNIANDHAPLRSVLSGTVPALLTLTRAQLESALESACSAADGDGAPGDAAQAMFVVDTAPRAKRPQPDERTEHEDLLLDSVEKMIAGMEGTSTARDSASESSEDESSDEAIKEKPLDERSSSAAPRKTPPPRKKLRRESVTADANNDGRVTRSEAHAAGILPDAADLNDDGRVTRSEARQVKRGIAKRLA